MQQYVDSLNSVPGYFRVVEVSVQLSLVRMIHIQAHDRQAGSCTTGWTMRTDIRRRMTSHV